MHFYDNVFLLVCFAVYVVDKRTVIFKESRLLLVKKRNVCDVFLAKKQAVQEINNQRFGYFLPEDSLESNVSEWVYEFCHNRSLLVSYAEVQLILCKDNANRTQNIKLAWILC